MIADLFRLHHERDLAPDGSAEQAKAQEAFRLCLQEMEKVRAQQLCRPTLAPELRHVLEFGARHWEELTRCAQDPHHPIDNNRDERQQRLPVIIRKNAYGSGAPWAATLACQVWTIGQTALQNGINPDALIRAYFEACAQAGGRVPDDWPRFVPLSLSPDDEGTAPDPAAVAAAAPSPAPTGEGLLDRPGESQNASPLPPPAAPPRGDEGAAASTPAPALLPDAPSPTVPPPPAAAAAPVPAAEDEATTVSRLPGAPRPPQAAVPAPRAGRLPPRRWLPQSQPP